MSTEPAADSSSTQPDEQTIGGSTNTADSSSTQPDEQTIGGSINTADSSSTQPDDQTIGGSTNTADNSSTQPDEQTIGGSTNTADSSSTQPDEQTIGGSTNTADSSSTQPDEQTIAGSTNTADSSSTQPDEQTIGGSTNTADSSSTQPDEQTIGGSINTADSSSTQPDEQTIGGSINTADSGSTQPDEQTIGGIINTVALLEVCILNADHDALQEHLENNNTEQRVLDRCLMTGLQIVQREEQEMGFVTPALQLLCQFGAKWNSDSLLKYQMTPYHLICLSAGDNHELLDLFIQSSEQTLLHAKDSYEYTALEYAVINANINCLRTLIVHGTDVNLGNDRKQPISLAMHELRDSSKHSPIIMTEIFDMLLDNGADVDKAMRFALSQRKVDCMKKLIMKDANLDYDDGYIWRMTARLGYIDLLKCLLDRGIDKDIIDQNGSSLLWWVTYSGRVDAVRYLLDLGVTLPTNMNVSKPCHELCKHCGINMLTTTNHIMLVLDDAKQRTQDPCMLAIYMDKLDVVQLLEEYGGNRYKHYTAIQVAVKRDSASVLEYLHRKYRHPLNTSYSASLELSVYKHWTFLKQACYHRSLDVVEYLLEHGADLNNVDTDRCSSALLVAIQRRQVDIIALLICNGVDINFRSYDYEYGTVLPFEAAVLHDSTAGCLGFFYIEMLLITGCSCGVYSLTEDHKFKAKHHKNEIKNLMMKWNVQENNVNPLKQQCRRLILKHLSPRASKMIENLPLPQCLIKYLSIPELDAIVARYKMLLARWGGGGGGSRKVIRHSRFIY